MKVLIYLTCFFFLFGTEVHAGRIDDLTKKAQQGSASAQVKLGEAFMNGKGVKKDLALAYSWLEKAAEQGYADGQRALGVMHELGLGTPKDLAKAAVLYRQAADQGLLRAQVNLGILHETGTGVEKDFAKAVEWYRKTAEKGYARGQTHLGMMYEKGLGVDKDEAQALYWYQKAAKLKYPRAERYSKQLLKKTGAIAEKGKPVHDIPPIEVQPPSPLENPADHYEKGMQYFAGRGVEKNLKKAAEWFQKAAEKRTCLCPKQHWPDDT